MEAGKVPVNPAGEVKVPAKLPMTKRRAFLRPVEARRVLDACEDPVLKFALYCGLHAGLRKLEVVEAVPGWFDLEEGLIHLDTTGPHFAPKDRDARTIPMTREFRDWLKKVFLKGRPRWKEEAFMMMPAVERGRHRYRWEFRKPFVAHMESLGLGHVTFHDLRRTFASLLVSKGVSIYKVAKWLGDQVKVVEATYGHLIPKDEDIDAVWGRAKRGRGERRKG
jgi:integrase